MPGSRYDRCIRQYDEIFAAEAANVPSAASTGNAALDAGLDWLTEGAQSVLDFGCGNGVALFFCALRGTRRHVGIDLSRRGIENALMRAEKMPCGEYAFTLGGVETLEKIADRSFDSLLLMNILDNLYPDDARTALRHAARVLKPGGRALIKLNPYRTEKQIREWNLRVIEGNLFDDGMLLWNNTDAAWRRIIRETLRVVEKREVYFPEYQLQERVFLAIRAEDML